MELKKGFLMIVLMGMICLANLCDAAPRRQGLPTDRHFAPEAYAGWRLGTQAYTFKEFTFFEAVDKAASLGIRYIEAFPSQKVAAQGIDIAFSDVNLMQMFSVKRKLAEAGVTAVSYGVVELPADEAQCRKVFEFARLLGVETLTAEPTEEALPLVDRLAKEYKIKVALHNHPKPSRYWDPKTVLSACQGRSSYIGACADTGHWMRSGVDPVEAIRLLKGRIVCLHLKDLNEFGNPKAHDVPWGTGAGKTAEVLKELHDQGFQGVFCAEYEYHWDNSVPELRQCVDYFNKTAAGLKSSGWQNLIVNGLADFQGNADQWAYKDGVLERVKDDGYVYTKKKYGDFILDLEFKMADKTNSGVFFHISDTQDIVQNSIEIQILDSFGKDKMVKNDCGAVYDFLAPSMNALRPNGQWNRMTLVVLKNKINVVLNGQPIIDMDVNQWTKPHQNPDGTPNKFDKACKNMPRTGYLGFQNHDESSIWYRNVWIKPLD